MPRVEIFEIVQDTNGNALSGASCQVNKREGGSATVYLDETSATTVANPIVTTSNGRIEGWLEGGSYNLVITPAVGAAYTQPFEANSGQNATITSAFPANPANGETIHYLADSTNGVVWTFKYRAASASTFKWEFIGGPPLTALVETSENTASLTYADLVTVGPSITAPLQGDYIVEQGCWIDPAAAAILALMSYAIGATAAADTHACVAGGDGGNDRHSVSRLFRHAGIAASTAFVSKYKVNASNANFRSRWMTLTPIRVTG